MPASFAREKTIDPDPRPSPNADVTYWAVLGRAASVSFLLHVVLGVLFELLGVSELFFLNLGFASAWMLVHILLRQQRNRLALVLVWGGICTHVASATVYLGWDSGFHYYLLPMAPFVFIHARRHTLLKLLLTGLLAIGYLGLDVYARRHAPLHPVDAGVTDLLRYLNVFATFGYLGYLAHVYFSFVGRVEHRLLTQATTDSLTGLPNRRRAMEIAAYEIKRCQRSGSSLCLVMADIDFFKRINDTHGHETGDQVLAGLAEVLRKSIRQVDTVARWGGEEFLMILPDTEPQAALLLAERAREAVAAADWPRGVKLGLTLGISRLREDERFEHALARADAALYRGKQAGRNRSLLDDTVPA